MSTAAAITITTLGHSCVLLEFGEGEDAIRLLLDPGNLTKELELPPLDAVLVTHAHPDHFDREQIARLRSRGPRMPIYGAPDLAPLIGDADVDFRPIQAGSFEVATVPITAILTPHETLYVGFPLPTNVGFLIAGRVYAAGDSLAQPDFPVDVLLAPLAGPWLKLSEAIDFVREVHPATAIPIHDAGLAPAHRGLHRALLGQFATEGTELVLLDPGQSVSL